MGEQTIDKAKISNLHTIKLERLKKLSEVEFQGYKKIKAAEIKVLDAKARLATAEAEKFVTATKEVEIAENELNVTKNIVLAEAQILNAKARLDLAKSEAQQVEQESAAKDLWFFETDTQLEAAEENLDTAVQQVEVAENNLKRVKGEKIDVGFMGTGWLKGWESSFDLGMNGSSGPSENFNFRAGFVAGYEDADDRWDFKSYYLTNSQNNDFTTNKANVSLLKDWFFTETEWFSFAGVIYDWDENKDWRQRVQLSAGPGYEFIKNDEWILSGRVGGTFVVEFGGKEEVPGSDPISYTPRENAYDFEVMVGADALWHISEGQTFIASNYTYARATDGAKMRNVANIVWQHDLDFFKGLVIKFNIHDEYDMTQKLAKNKNDFQYGVALGLGF
ncbi:MAG: DUF481 domain-containing protein [Methylococcaceae bacterium]|nr:DUF481 domain-containing protein [Methylococcaceae bacterium]